MEFIPESFAPLLLTMTQNQAAPVILTSPHSGRFYTPAFLASSRLDAAAIRRSEDSYVDELLACAPGLGLPVLAANFPRAYCDVNREAWELDPTMFEDRLPDYVNTISPRVQAGLGTIARIVGTGEVIYRDKLRFAQAEARIAACWQPYHDTLRNLIDATLAGFGVCLVIDCHSMPSPPGQRGKNLAEIVLGDVHGTSCAPGITGFFESGFSQMGLKLRRNEPYAGGYITRHYGRPLHGVHVLQVEFLRALYMNEASLRKNAGFAVLAAQIGAMLAKLMVQLDDLLPPPQLPQALAAE